MITSKYRDMRIVLFFDLPTKTEKDKKQYQQFKKFLNQDGYLMMQYSVYSRFCRNYAAIDKHLKRLENNKPKVGDVRILTITEKQYHSMIFLTGELREYEKCLTNNPIVEI